MSTLAIRHAVFETNSSSSHSLTLGPGALVRLPLGVDVFRDGTLPVEFGTFGWEEETYSDLPSKLSYLFTQVHSSLRYATSNMQAEFEADVRVQRIRRVVREFLGLELTLPSPCGYVDHQSVGICDGVLASDEELRVFLFDPASSFTTDNDNH